MGRGHNLQDFYQAVDLFTSYKNKSDDIHTGVNFKSINTDMIMGLPYESKKEVLYTAEKMIDLDVEHISAYILELEPGTKFGKKYTELEGPLPSEPELEEIFTSTHYYLMDKGFERYSFASFAKKDQKS
jgi:oxygen-independent coproporphyrinogen III oxidase